MFGTDCGRWSLVLRLASPPSSPPHVCVCVPAGGQAPPWVRQPPPRPAVAQSRLGHLAHEQQGPVALVAAVRPPALVATACRAPTCSLTPPLHPPPHPSFPPSPSSLPAYLPPAPAPAPAYLPPAPAFLQPSPPCLDVTCFQVILQGPLLCPPPPSIPSVVPLRSAHSPSTSCPSPYSS